MKKVISVFLVLDHFDGNTPKEKLLYFLSTFKRLRVSEENLLIKSWKELEYIHYQLKIIKSATARWSEFIKKQIQIKQRGISYKTAYPVVHKYDLHDGTIVHMPRGGA